MSRMSISTRRRLRSEVIRAHSYDDENQGTAARTRPLTYDEIMLKRKSKKGFDGFREEAGEREGNRREENAKHHDHHSRDTNRASTKNSRDYAREGNSRKKEEMISRMEDGHGKNKNKESRDVESRSKHKYEKDERTSNEAFKDDSRGHGRRKLDEHLRDETRYDYEKRHHVAQDRYLERSRGAPERENKRKYRIEDDEKYKIRDPVKKHDSGNRRESEISERKEKMELSSQPRHDDKRSKRRRSRSHEDIKEKGRRSRSSSPQARKNMSSHGHDHGELSLHSQRDKSRNHSDILQSKMSSNGSTSHHSKNIASSSGLGGYSPRKRKTEAAIKTPSPPIGSPERKSAGWNLPPSGADGNLSGTQLFSQTKSSNVIELAAGISITSSMGKPLSAILSSNLSGFKEASIDSIQLTQATRPMRRLYIDNIPVSASEKDVTECFNNFLLSSGANHIRGTRPCISCMIHKEKGQALVEFLTPEDASAALSFDGGSFFGSVLKIRRPKDFVEVASGSSERSKAGVDSDHLKDSSHKSVPLERSKVGADAISDIVKDSPHKIFIGGIAECLSSEMIMEIVSAFGSLKAYHFKINEDLNEPCAFVEFTDPSVTLKACAGLNGMKLGGRVLTVAQAVPNTTSLENYESMPFYGIPEHVKPLLELPTQVLKLSNMIDPKDMKLLSEADLEEILEDIRLECSRFGSVVSINVVKTSNGGDISKTKVVLDDVEPLQHLEERGSDKHPSNVELAESSMDHADSDGCEMETPNNTKERDAGDSVKGDKHEMATTSATGVEDISVSARKTNDYDVNHHEMLELDPNEIIMGNENDGEIPKSEHVLELEKSEEKIHELVTVSNDCATKNLGSTENVVENENTCDTGNLFEVGCVLVEFRRPEVSCIAAHCLHGRMFDDRIVMVEYVPLDVYRARFPK